MIPKIFTLKIATCLREKLQAVPHRYMPSAFDIRLRRSICKLDMLCVSKASNERTINMKKSGEPLAMFFAVSFLVSLRFTIRRMVKKYSGVKL